ncbi:LON peptidase substrate-binding domain-containing protein [Sphingomonas sp. RG327]|jgi:Lon protease-like protein|uniref:LON peptidase substrate-binding domain-containing protein n=2 Tax=Sphingomonas anseongensis TaxID=2908207 RepID=A0ABT0RGP2_9SPHN|nr:LON peptidase substrate-binding domain-containing protein [Sphingomonas anseongensis]MCL6679429.1 LON peptidase substrate-binding domain-containing protein [Sphingomonas anseongensis]
MRAPLFPIAGAILFPRAQLPLHIFEPRYREMVRDAVDGDGRIAIVQPQLVEVEDDRKQPIYPVGCVGEIVGLEELEDGRFNIVLNGSNRFRIISEVDLETPYRNADLDVGAFDDREPEPLGMVERAEVEREARRLGDALGLAVDWSAVSRLDDEMLVNAIAQVAPFDVSAKQALLESETLDARTDLLVQLMQFLRLSQGNSELQPTLQ